MLSIGLAQRTYVGSEACSTCHADKVADWQNSGHPYKFTVIENNQPPIYPDFVVNFQDQWMDSLGDGSHTWADIAGVIGGFGWKSRFVGTDGYIIGTAGSSFGDAGYGHNQFNFFGGEEHGWVDYDKDKTTKLYNYGCFKCHTTGGDTSGTWLSGVDGLGNFSEGGIGCESCHGPGSAHASTGNTDYIDRVYEYAHLDNSIGGLVWADGDTVRPSTDSDNVNYLCGTCHNRSYTYPINSKGGFIKHHEQWDEFVTSRHGDLGFKCTTCHDPHKRVVWEGDGIKTMCETCHADKASQMNHAVTLNCIDCHMPFAAKSGTTRGKSGYKGDVRSHLFTIIPDTNSIFTDDGSAVRDDEVRTAALNVQFACLGCHNDDPNDAIPDKTPAEVLAGAQNMHSPLEKNYVGSEACASCHDTKYTDWKDSGHPYKFTVIENNQPPTYPDFVVNFQDQWMDSLGDGSHTWADIAGVIGGFGWKSRFVGTDGYIIGTAGSSFGDAGYGHNQFNFFGGEEHGWVDYDKDKTTKLYNYGCFKCHTTGGDTSGTWLSGVDGLGNFSEGGIGCESCHGPGSAHASTGNTDYIDRVYEYAHLDNSIGGLVWADGDTVRPSTDSDNVNYLCGTCHNRSYTYPINSKGGFIKHHEQWDEMIASPHGDQSWMNCSTCHDPHKRVVWDGEGITKTCQDCHSNVTVINDHTTVNCIDCHMAFAAKSGTTRGQSGYKGDVRSHLFRIIPDTNSIFTEDGSAVKDDAERQAALNVQFACLGCHNDDPDDGITNKTLAEALASAQNIHGLDAIVGSENTIPKSFALKQNFPNPFNPGTQIVFHLPKRSHVKLTVYNMAGQLVATIVNQVMEPGVKQINFNASSLPSGVYFYRIQASEYSDTRKMVLLK